MAATGASEYRKMQILTATPEQLQLMLWDGVIRFTQQARQAIEQRDREASHNLLIKAQNIVMELNNGLRPELAPDLCAQLRALYMYLYRQLITANVQKQIEPLDDALKIMQHQRETWAMLIERLAAERAAAAPTDTVDEPPPRRPAMHDRVSDTAADGDLPRRAPSRRAMLPAMTGGGLSVEG